MIAAHLSHQAIKRSCTLDPLCHDRVIVEVCAALTAAPMQFGQWGIAKWDASLWTSLVFTLEWQVQKRPHVQGRKRCIGVTATPSGRCVSPRRAGHGNLVLSATNIFRNATGRHKLRARAGKITQIPRPRSTVTRQKHLSHMMLEGDFQDKKIVT